MPRHPGHDWTVARPALVTRPQGLDLRQMIGDEQQLITDILPQTVTKCLCVSPVARQKTRADAVQQAGLNTSRRTRKVVLQAYLVTIREVVYQSSAFPPLAKGSSQNIAFPPLAQGLSQLLLCLAQSFGSWLIAHQGLNAEKYG